MKTLVFLILILMSHQFNIAQIWKEVEYERDQHYNIHSFPTSITSIDAENSIITLDNAGFLEIIKSNDNGKTWQSINKIIKYKNSQEPSPKPNDLITGYLTHGNKYYVAYEEGKIKRSNDGGKTFYDTLDLEPNINRRWNFYMHNDKYGILNNTVEMYVTKDGWDTYKKIDIEEDVDKFGFFGVSYIDEDKIITHRIYNPWYRLSISYDFGETWNSSEDLGYKINACSFVDENTGWVCGSQDIGVGQTKYDIIYKTEDGGKTWEEQMWQKDDYKPWGLSDISFKDEKNGVATGAQAKIYRTTDGGQTWMREHLEIWADMPDSTLTLTQRVGWIEDVPIIGTFDAGIFRLEEATSVENLLKEENILVNQTNTNLLVSIEDASFSDYEVSISDMNGNILATKTIQSGRGSVLNRIDIGNLGSGAYVYMITTNNSKIKSGVFNVLR